VRHVGGLGWHQSEGRSPVCVCVKEGIYYYNLFNVHALCQATQETCVPHRWAKLVPKKGGVASSRLKCATKCQYALERP
jgi:hypothetical protein